MTQYWSAEQLKAKVPVYAWPRKLPEKTLRQLVKVARQPYVVGRVAAMPDAHVANGVAVGTVFATDGVIVPEALGGDLGCGVSAVCFDVTSSSLDTPALSEVLVKLTRTIPTGDAVHRSNKTVSGLYRARLSTHALEHACERLHFRHLGTLGGGNHFIELDRDLQGRLWLLVHSGSRGIGSAIADHHVRVARSIGSGSIRGLALEDDAGRNCLNDYAVALNFAHQNRMELIRLAADAIAHHLGALSQEVERIDVHHNFVAEEVHDGRALLVHRKGAIRASRGVRAVIPGSMATASYVVEGKGEALSFESASHGAGRVLTRSEARAQVRPKQLAHAMRRVVFDASKLESLVEESPAAYRNVAEVLEDEADLVSAINRLEPMLVLKG
jgi:tRNA-splicing ligase RtcB (3'-phosphate/5'-hydroxy nucleic acid ligase)